MSDDSDPCSQLPPSVSANIGTIAEHYVVAKQDGETDTLAKPADAKAVLTAIERKQNPP